MSSQCWRGEQDNTATPFTRLAPFCDDERGATALIFAFALIPMVALAGAAIDYGQANTLKTEMQSALDSTALAMSKYAGTLNQGDLQTKATAYFQALFNKPQAQNLKFTIQYTTNNSTSLVASASAQMPTSVMGIMGFSSITIGATSTAAWGSSRLRVALVLDNTGSMAESNKMNSLKTAAKNLVTKLRGIASQNGDVYVSVVPFAEDVNVGASNYSASWIRWDLWEETNGSCSKHSYDTKSTCEANKRTWTANSHAMWNGCVTDRDQDNDVSNAAPSSGQLATLFPAEQYGYTYNGTFYDWCPTALLPLTYDWTAISSKIDDMQPNGYTNQAIGLQWGFQSLTNAPLTIPPKDSNYQYKDIIVLFTDGLNTSDRWYPYGNAQSQALIDARQTKTCSNIKAAGIVLYAIQISTDGESSSSLLQSCASDGSKFYFLTSASQIADVFDSIGSNLTQLRITK